ncbi:MAG TPA: hypothetical protein VNN72_14680 [Polyangiaceae bacterium]|nr:hypothetical protein [Polyangiaceae bacterium]
MRRLSVLPAKPSAESSELERASLLLQVKATPVVFLERPAARSSDPVVREWRRRLAAAEMPGRVLAKLLGTFKHFPAFVRDVLLTDGYLYATTAPLGATLAEGVTLGQLFREPRVVIERGAARIVAESDGEGGYVYGDGPDKGKPARLVLFDRVWAEGAEPGARVHVELGALQASLGFDSIVLERVTEQGIVATARYGTKNVPTLLDRAGASLELGCEVAGADATELARFREQASRRRRAWERVREMIRTAIDENLPFDEPRTEYGQEDGKLRQHWREAYFQGATRYDFNGDTYAVFDRQGRPLVPQVCIDFVVDTLERAGGAWYAAQDQPRARSIGRVDFDATGTLNRRNVEEFLALAKRRPEWFEQRAVPPEEQVALERRPRFLSTLFEHRSEYRPGDVVVILGPRADEKLHYHSFFVFDADPVTGMPSLVAGNSGRPRVRAWTSEMASAPKRSVVARMRPSLSFLEQAWPAPPAEGARPLTAQAEPLRSPATP